MRPLRSLFVYLVAVFLAGALTAPWWHAAAQELARHAPAFDKIARAPFHRYVNRALLIAAVIGLWPLLRSLRACSFRDLGLGGRGASRSRGCSLPLLSRREERVGERRLVLSPRLPLTPTLSPSDGEREKVSADYVPTTHLGMHGGSGERWASRLGAGGAGFVVGFFSLACVALLALAVGARHVQPGLSAGAVLGQIANAGLSALLVGTLEEVLFRGAIFGAIRKAHDWRIALVASSSVYGLVHFFARARSPDQITWLSGFETLGQMVHGFGDVKMLVPGFFSLTLAGMILGLAYQQTGSLYFPIGLHAGWIFWLKLYGAITVEQGGDGAGAWFWGTGKLIDGWSALVVLVPLFLVLWFRPRPQTPDSHDR